MKKLFLITVNFPFGKGESFILPELGFLAKRFDVTIVTDTLCTEQTSALPDGVKVMRVDTGKLSRKLIGRIRAIFSPEFRREWRLIKKSGGSLLKKALYSLSYYSLGDNFAHSIIADAKKNGAPDIIYSYWHDPPVFGAVIRRKKLGNPLIITRAHGRDLFAERKPMGFMPFKREVDSQIDRVFLISRDGMDYYLKNYSVSEPAKCEVSYLGTDSAGSAPTPFVRRDRLRIVSCSYMQPLKRVDLLIDALAVIESLQIEWTHIGGGLLEPELREKAAHALGGKSNISYSMVGSLHSSAVKELMANGGFDCFITVSASEGLPVSIMEAVSLSIPVIATDVGGIREIVGDETGILLKSDPTAAEVAQAITSFAKLSDEQRLCMRRAAYDIWKRNFCAGDNAARFAARIDELCEEKKRHIDKPQCR